MDTQRLIDVAPHYLAMLLLAFLIPAVVRLAVGDIGFWPELVLIFFIVFGYRRAVLRLDVAPAAWEEGRR
ncbi:MAG: hypothetical protein ABEJ34_02290 [Haloferacaceae archaeon]